MTNAIFLDTDGNGKYDAPLPFPDVLLGALRPRPSTSACPAAQCCIPSDADPSAGSAATPVTGTCTYRYPRRRAQARRRGGRREAARSATEEAARERSSLVVRSRRVVTGGAIRPAAIHVAGGVIARSRRLRRRPARRARSSTRATTSSRPASSTRTSTSTSPAAPSGRASRPPRAPPRPAASPRSSTCRSTASRPRRRPRSLEAKRAAARGQCWVDVGFWGGAVPGNAGELVRLLDAGALGFKCFLVDSGVPEFGCRRRGRSPRRHARDRRRRRAAPRPRRAARPDRGRARRDARPRSAPRTRPTSARARARPRTTADRAARRASAARRARASTSSTSPRRARSTRSARARGRGPALHGRDHAALPPLRRRGDPRRRDAVQVRAADPRARATARRLWGALDEGLVEHGRVATTRPCTPALKKLEAGDFDAAWGGIASLQLGLPVVWTDARAARALARRPRRVDERRAPRASRGLAQQGRASRPARDADLVDLGPGRRVTVAPDDDRAPPQAHALRGRDALRAPCARRILRGETVFDRTARPRASATPPASPRGACSSRTKHERLPRPARSRRRAPRRRRALTRTTTSSRPRRTCSSRRRPVFLEHEYTDRGKWMDGWESRRRRTPGHDWCLVRLGLPGVVRGVVVDTAFFRGNYPDACLDRGVRRARRRLAARSSSARRRAGSRSCPKSALRGDSKNVFAIDAPHRFTHLRLNIFPDGGVARLRVHGEVVPDCAAARRAAPTFDLAAVENGGQVLSCSDMFFGVRHNLIMPGRAANMGDGWETKRRARPRLRLGARPSSRPRRTLARVEVDTNHFKGNYPDTCMLEGCQAGAAIDVERRARGARSSRARSSRRTRSTSSTTSSSNRGPFTHVRLNIFPDGGVSRLRVFGALTRDGGRARAASAGSTRSSRDEAEAELLACCGSRAWARAMADAAPVRGPSTALLDAAERPFGARSAASDWLEAFRAHPRIGEKKAERGRRRTRRSAWSEKEQGGVAGARPRRSPRSPRRTAPTKRSSATSSSSARRARAPTRCSPSSARASATHPSDGARGSRPRSSARSPACAWRSSSNHERDHDPRPRHLPRPPRERSRTSSLEHPRRRRATARSGAGATDADGRLRTLLPAGEPLVAGSYRLTFHTGGLLRRGSAWRASTPR